MNLKKIILILLFVFIPITIQNKRIEIPETSTLSFVFMGDIMGHGPQIRSALNPTTKEYEYDTVFSHVAPIIQAADIAVANLEVTLAGSPYSGYPRFSSPDALAQTCKTSGIDVLVTSNNHSCDRGKKGVIRTLDILDTLGIQHTGTFRNATERTKNNLLILEKNNIKVGLLNYTYGTNGLPIPETTVVNLIDTTVMLQDIRASQQDSLDKLIVMTHWGGEYQSHPSKEQTQLAELLFKNGVDIIVGAHPHVLQKMEYHPKSTKQKERLIAYSLGNFVSNQRTRKRDGGAMLAFTLTKEKGNTHISDTGYHLAWVNKAMVGKRRFYTILPCATFEANNFEGLDNKSIQKMKVFMSDSRKLYDKGNIDVKEIKNK